MTADARVVQTLQDVLKAFPSALSRLPANTQVHRAQRAVKVLDQFLTELKETIEGG